MKKQSIRKHLRPFSIAGRGSTISHAFASAIASVDKYDESAVDEAVRVLGQDPSRELVCVYCGDEAETWDHVFPLVRGTQYSGYGHVLGNLVPSCGKCNTSKRNKDWAEFVGGSERIKSPVEVQATLKRYFMRFSPKQRDYKDTMTICSKELREYELLRREVLNLLKRADRLASEIRAKVENERRSD
ncbi:MAG: HNH endonuclease [Chloroflexi bacterium]|nr:HNH endonuclease [Chloroflexota bacterium]